LAESQIIIWHQRNLLAMCHFKVDWIYNIGLIFSHQLIKRTILRIYVYIGYNMQLLDFARRFVIYGVCILTQ